MEFGKFILFETSYYTIYTDLNHLIILTGSLLLQGLLAARLLVNHQPSQ
jgi:hypothetical protein